MSSKYYAVHIGKLTGVFKDWNLVKGFVNGYPGAIYKSFNKYEDAEYFYKTGKSKVSKAKIQNNQVLEQRSQTLNSIPSRDVNQHQNVQRRSLTDDFKHSIENFFIHDSHDNINNNESNVTVDIYTDGSCIDNKGGYGYVLVNANETFTGKKGRVPYIPCTNNIAELYAIYMALKNHPDININIYSDSEYSVNIFSKWLNYWKGLGWKRTNGDKIQNLELIKEIESVLNAKNRLVTFKHVRGHAGHPINEMADSLAKEGVNMQV